MSDQADDVPEDVKARENREDAMGIPADDSADILEELKPWIDAGEIHFESESDRYYALIESKYPIGLNRVAWKGIRNHWKLDILQFPTEELTGPQHEKKLVEVRHRLLDLLASKSINQQELVVWTGDSTTICLHMTVASIIEVYPLLFSWPQHHYVIPSSGAWCLNYTMEGQLFFGKEEDAVARGCVDLDFIEER